MVVRMDVGGRELGGILEGKCCFFVISMGARMKACWGGVSDRCGGLGGGERDRVCRTDYTRTEVGYGGEPQRICLAVERRLDVVRGWTSQSRGAAWQAAY